MSQIWFWLHFAELHKLDLDDDQTNLWALLMTKLVELWLCTIKLTDKLNFKTLSDTFSIENVLFFEIAIATNVQTM